MTSSIDFLPKFGIAASSPSDLETRSPTVWIPARFVVERGDARRAGAQLLDAVLVGEDRQGGDEDLRRVAQRRLGIDRAVRLDVERELVEVGALADARLLDVVGH